MVTSQYSEQTNKQKQIYSSFCRFHCVNRGNELQSEGTSGVNRGNELQFEKASCVNRENEIVIYENGFTIRRDGLHKLRYSYLFLLFFFAHFG